MAKPTAPLLSFGASGQIANSLVFANWKGRPYARRYVIPSNPQSTAQTVTRSLFSWCNSVWKVAPGLFVAPWDLYATGQVMTGRNAFISSAIRAMRGDVDLANMIFSPGAKGGLAPTSIGVTPGSGQLAIAIGVPTAPSGWTIDAAVAAVIADQDPQTEDLYTITAGEDVSSPYTVTITGLPAVLHQCGAWIRWIKPDGTFAYGASLQDTGTPS